MTLDPPGTIAVVGGGPLGIEAALYGRFLGYDVTLIEAGEIAGALHSRRGEPLPISPDRCLSPLSVAALQAQEPEFAGQPRPMSIGQWIDQALVPLTETDLLRGRVRTASTVLEIDTIAVDLDDDQDAADEIPPDFRLQISVDDSEPISLQAESVILAIADDSIPLRFDVPAAYFFRVGQAATGSPEHDYAAGLREIVSVYASLAGREDLDLYRPRRI